MDLCKGGYIFEANKHKHSLFGRGMKNDLRYRGLLVP